MAEDYHFDVLVIGTGIAGLSVALRMGEYCKVGLVTKKNDTESNTNYAQGGIAAVWSEQDSYDLHVQDTLIAGADLCREELTSNRRVTFAGRRQSCYEGTRFGGSGTGICPKQKVCQGQGIGHRSYHDYHGPRRYCRQADGGARRGTASRETV